MNSKICPHCHCNTKIIKYGTTSSGRHRYKCKNCNRTWTSTPRLSRIEDKIWHDYVFSNMTIETIAGTYNISLRKVSRIIKNYKVSPIIPPKDYHCDVIHTDVTYVGHKYGFLSVLDTRNGKCLYCGLTRGHETVYDYEKALNMLNAAGIYPKAVVMDGIPGAMKMFKNRGLYVQMCQFHMISIMTKYLTRNPVLEQNKELRNIVKWLPRTNKKQFEGMFYSWKLKNELWLRERHENEEGKLEFSHQKTRSLVRSLCVLIPFLFTYELHPELTIPKTNNKIEGVHSALKCKLNTHRGAKKAVKIKIAFNFLSGRTEVKKHTK